MYVINDKGDNLMFKNGEFVLDVGENVIFWWLNGGR